MIIIKIAGYLLIVWGLLDLVLSFGGTDLWLSVLGINLEGIMYQYSHVGAIIIGGLLTQVGRISD